MEDGSTAVSRIGAEEVESAVAVLADAFRTYPVLRFVVGPDVAPADPRIMRLTRFFLMARVYRREPIFGVRREGELMGVALVSNPGGPPSPPEVVALREETWALLGPDARSRYEAFGAACLPFQTDAPHLHLNMIGVRRQAQGHGFGRQLLDAVHRLARDTADMQGVSLTTEVPMNVPLYEHFGYQLVGHAQVAPGLETWGLYRPNEAPSGSLR